MIDLCFAGRAGRIAHADRPATSKVATIYIGEADMTPRQQLPRRVPSRESETIRDNCPIPSPAGTRGFDESLLLIRCSYKLPGQAQTIVLK